MWIFQLREVGAPNPHLVQGSTVLSFGLMLKTSSNRNFSEVALFSHCQGYKAMQPLLKMLRFACLKHEVLGRRTGGKVEKSGSQFGKEISCQQRQLKFHKVIHSF